MDAVQIISQVGAFLVALAALASGVWTTNRTLRDKREERLWQPRADLYVDLMQVVLAEQRTDDTELEFIAESLDDDATSYWQSALDRDVQKWKLIRARVWAYASNGTRDLYVAWEAAVRRMAGVVQPERVTGSPRTDQYRALIKEGIEKVNATGDRLIGQIRDELKSDRY